MENELEEGRQQKELEKEKKEETKTKTYTLRREIPNPANHNKNKLFLAPKHVEITKTVDKKKRRWPLWNGFNTWLYAPAGGANKDERN